MRSATTAFVVLWWAGTCLAQGGQQLCPKHIETPFYPAIAHMAHVSGTVTLTLTIDADGNVRDVKANSTVNPPGDSKLLERDTITNVRRWTFATPPSAPYTQTIVYDYKIDDSGRRHEVAVSFDLPDHVTIWAEPSYVEPDQTEVPRNKTQ
jgi:TonB family protein